MEQEIIEKLNMLSRKHKELEVEINKLKYEDEGIKNEIKLICEANNIVDFLDNDGFIINITTQSRTTFDKEKAKQFIPEDKFKECFKTGNEFKVIRWIKQKI